MDYSGFLDLDLDWTFFSFFHSSVLCFRFVKCVVLLVL